MPAPHGPSGAFIYGGDAWVRDDLAASRYVWLPLWVLPPARGDPLPAVTDSVPADASASAAGMANWLAQVALTAPDDREPLDVAPFAPPQPEDTEPEALK